MQERPAIPKRRRGLRLWSKRPDGLWFSNNPFQHAAALAFCTLFSLAPLLIILVAVTGAVFGEEAVHGEIFARLVGRIGPQAAAAVEEAVRQVTPRRGRRLGRPLLAVVALLFGGTSVFAQMQTSLNQYLGGGAALPDATTSWCS